MMPSDVGAAPAAPATYTVTSRHPGAAARRDRADADGQGPFGDLVDRYADDPSTDASREGRAGASPRRQTAPASAHHAHSARGPVPTSDTGAPATSDAVHGHDDDDGDDEVDLEHLAHAEGDEDEDVDCARPATSDVVTTAPVAQPDIVVVAPLAAGTAPADGAGTPVAGVPSTTGATLVTPSGSEPGMTGRHGEHAVGRQVAAAHTAEQADVRGVDVGEDDPTAPVDETDPETAEAASFAASVEPRAHAQADARSAASTARPNAEEAHGRWRSIPRPAEHATSARGAHTAPAADPRDVAMAAIRQALAGETPVAQPTAVRADVNQLPGVPSPEGVAAQASDDLTTTSPLAPGAVATSSDEATPLVGTPVPVTTATAAVPNRPAPPARTAAATPAAAPDVPVLAQSEPAQAADTRPTTEGAVSESEPGGEVVEPIRTASQAPRKSVGVAPQAPHLHAVDATAHTESSGSPSAKAPTVEPPVLARPRPMAHAAQAIAAFQAVAAASLGAGTAELTTMAAEAPRTMAMLDQELPTPIIQAIRVQAEQGGGQARMRLNPGFLGGVSVDVRVDGATVVAALQASNPEVREWMRTNEAALRQSLADQGLHLAQLVIADDEAQTGAEDDRRQQGGSGNRQEPKRQRRQNGTSTFEALL